MIKTLIGKKNIWEYDHIIKKCEYNELVKKEYKGKEPIFDIAEIESTNPDGTINSFTRNGQSYYSMASLYTDDGGHLNKTGRRKVAEQLLLLLVSLN